MFYKDIDMSKVTRKQVVQDWKDLFPEFSEKKERKCVTLRQVNIPVIKTVVLDFDKSNPYDVHLIVKSFFGGYSRFAANWVPEKKHYLIISRDGERQVNYKYTYNCLINRCEERDINFYEPLSITKIIDLYKSDPLSLESSMFESFYKKSCKYI